eukprot:m.32498 g.32498  ORF g.32498 m.32498 type:complete len:383 (-) comp8420_c0_seq1:338-1486(-)
MRVTIQLGKRGRGNRLLEGYVEIRRLSPADRTSYIFGPCVNTEKFITFALTPCFNVEKSSNPNDNSWQYHTIDRVGPWTIKVYGASGAGMIKDGLSAFGGLGASVQTSVFLEEGDVLKIIAGIPGENYVDVQGGGGSLVVKERGNVLLAAAGGGGGGYVSKRTHTDKNNNKVSYYAIYDGEPGQASISGNLTQASETFAGESTSGSLYKLDGLLRGGRSYAMGNETKRITSGNSNGMFGFVVLIPPCPSGYVFHVDVYQCISTTTTSSTTSSYTTTSSTVSSSSLTTSSISSSSISSSTETLTSSTKSSATVTSTSMSSTHTTATNHKIQKSKSDSEKDIVIIAVSVVVGVVVLVAFVYSLRLWRRTRTSGHATFVNPAYEE